MSQANETREAARPSPEELGLLLARAERGDQTVLDELRAFLDAHPEVWRQVGDVAWHAEQVLLDLAAGNNLLFRESVSRKLGELKRELSPASPLERLLAERVAVCWLAVYHGDVDAVAAQQNNASGARSAYAQKRLGQAHHRFLQAVKQLALVRKLLRPALSPAEVARRTVDETGAGRQQESWRGGRMREAVSVGN